MSSQYFSISELPKEHQDLHALTLNNPLLLVRTVLAGENACKKMKIEKYGYQLAYQQHNQDNCLIIFIVLSSSLQPNQVLAPYNIISKISNDIMIKRISLGIMQYSNPALKNMKKENSLIASQPLEIHKNRLINVSIFPKIPVAKELCIFLNDKSEFSGFLSKFMSQNMFVVSTKVEQIYFDINWIQDELIQKQNYNFSLMMNRYKAYHKKQKFRNYLKVQIKGLLEEEQSQRYGCCLFEPTKTAIFIQKASHYQLDNIFKRINLPKLYHKIFSQPVFQSFAANLATSFEEKIDKKFILLRTPKSIGISSLIHFLAQQNGYNFVRLNCKYFISEKQLISSVKKCEDFGSSVIFIKNIEWLLQVGLMKLDRQQLMKHLLRNLEDVLAKMGQNTLQSFILIVNYQGNIIRYDMTRDASLEVLEPNKQERIKLLQTVCEFFESEQSEPVFLEDSSQICNLMGSTLGWKKFYDIFCSFSKKVSPGEKIGTNQFIKEISKFMEIESVENIKNIGWDDVGGLKQAKEQIIQTILLPTKHPEIFDQWIKPRTGILFYGPPGTGKTMLGKCIANQCKMGFISVKGPELLNMYIGESQKNVRQVFERAAANKPCIIFMDQLDALIPKRGQSSDSNQVMDRIVSELLSQMDRAAGNGIFIIGATNRPDLLDPSILRTGRFDKQIYLGILNDQVSRMQVLQAQTRNITLRQNFDYKKVLEHVPLNFTGADFYGLTSRSILKAAERFIEKTNKVVVIQEDFIITASNMKPSVSTKQLQHYEKLKQMYK